MKRRTVQILLALLVKLFIGRHGFGGFLIILQVGLYLLVESIS